MTLIAVIEDEDNYPFYFSIVADYLPDYSLEFKFFKLAQQFLPIENCLNYDLIFLDLELAKGTSHDGYDLIRMLNNVRGCPHTIIITGIPTEDSLLPTTGPNTSFSILHKPIPVESTVAKIRTHCTR